MDQEGIFSLNGKVALVTGATGHLGARMVFALAEAGAEVLVNSRSVPKVNELVSRCNARGLSVAPAIFDVSHREEVAEFFGRFDKAELDIVINNAYAGGSGNLQYADSSSYRESYEVSVVAAHTLLQAALPYLREAVRKNGDASIINISSMYGVVSPDLRIYRAPEECNPPFYGAAKAALLQWTRYAACELAREGIRVNAISPGPFPSERVQASQPALIQELIDRVPLGRIGNAEEISGPVVFLASSASSYVNGANLVVDGGWTCW